MYIFESGAVDTKGLRLHDRLLICRVRSWLQPSEHFWLEGGSFLMNTLCAWVEQTNSPSWLAWRSRGGTCCHEAWGCCCPRQQEGGAAADASLPRGKEDGEGLSLALFTVGAVAVVLALCPGAVLVFRAASCRTDGSDNTLAEDAKKCGYFFYAHIDDWG